MNVIESARSKPRKSRVNQWQAVFNTLQSGIISGKFRSGVRLIEDDIIEQTGATRHAARKAFDELERLGLVIRYPNRGVQVRHFTAREVREIYEVRECLELKAVEGYTEPATKKFINILNDISEKHEKAVEKNDLGEMFRLNNIFHETVYGKSKNKILLSAIKHHSLLAHLIQTNAVQSKEMREAGLRDHEAIVKAIEVGDQKALAGALLRHLTRFRDYYLQTSFSE